jgi:hypothetical protein
MTEIIRILGTTIRGEVKTPPLTAASFRRLRGYPYWTEIARRACDLFAHPSFDERTWDRLIDWLLDGRVADINSLGWAPRNLVVEWLDEAIREREGRNLPTAPLPPTPPPPDVAVDFEARTIRVRRVTYKVDDDDEVLAFVAAVAGRTEENPITFATMKARFDGLEHSTHQSRIADRARRYIPIVSGGRGFYQDALPPDA